MIIWLSIQLINKLMKPQSCWNSRRRKSFGLPLHRSNLTFPTWDASFFAGLKFPHAQVRGAISKLQNPWEEVTLPCLEWREREGAFRYQNVEYQGSLLFLPCGLIPPGVIVDSRGADVVGWNLGVSMSISYSWTYQRSSHKAWVFQSSDSHCFFSNQSWGTYCHSDHDLDYDYYCPYVEPGYPARHVPTLLLPILPSLLGADPGQKAQRGALVPVCTMGGCTILWLVAVLRPRQS